VTIVHTSEREAGQIYVPEVNRALMVGCLALVVTFRTAGALAAAYGIAVTGTMVITSVLFAVVARGRWGWPLWRVALVTAAFLAVDLAFLGANLVKVVAGGWVPLALAGVLFALMTTWKAGRETLARLLREGALPLDLLLEDVARRRLHRVPGTAVFMTPNTDGAPGVLLHHLKHNKVLHEEVVLLSVQSAEVPDVDDAEEALPQRLDAHAVGDRVLRAAAGAGGGAGGADRVLGPGGRPTLPVRPPRAFASASTALTRPGGRGRSAERHDPAPREDDEHREQAERSEAAQARRNGITVRRCVVRLGRRAGRR
jgi:KUP system potassium uptake protein